MTTPAESANEILEAHLTHMQQAIEALEKFKVADDILLGILTSAQYPPGFDYRSLQQAAKHHDDAKELLIEATTLMADDFKHLCKLIGETIK